MTLLLREGQDGQWDLAPLFLGLTLGILSLYIFTGMKRRNDFPLPPGPKGIPIFGNLFQIAIGRPWLLYAQWAKEYGEVMYLEAMGKPIIVLNSLPAAIDLLEKRAVNFSGRPTTPALQLLTQKSNWNLALMDYGPWWRAHRRSFHQYLNANEIKVYHPIIESHTMSYMRNLVKHREDVLEDTELLFGSIIM